MFASPASEAAPPMLDVPDEAQPSTSTPAKLFYRPFESWAPNSDWTLDLPAGEEALGLAVGATFAAAITSRRLLRVFSLAGAQTAVRQLPGQPVAVAARGSRLAVVYHRSAPAEDGTQSLEYLLVDTLERRRLQVGPVALSAGALLTWLGFSDEGVLCTGDSAGVVCCLDQDFGGGWLPVWEAAAVRRSEESYWVVGVQRDAISAIVCPRALDVPQVVPKPVQSVFALRVPLLRSGDERREGLEDQLLRAQAALSDREWGEGLGVAPSEGPGGEALWSAAEWRTEVDKLLLRLVNEDCKRDRCARALELCGMMNNTELLEKAVLLADATRRTVLQERIVALVETRRAQHMAPTPFHEGLGDEAEEEEEEAVMEYYGTVERYPENREAAPKPTTPAVAAPAAEAATRVAPLFAGKKRVADTDVPASNPLKKRAALQAAAGAGNGTGNPFARGGNKFARR